MSIKIGKRPRDLLNPKAVKYMQSVFSIKDAISKKESREISALFGVTVTQVRDFFNSQRSRVRKFVRLSREKAIRLKAPKDSNVFPPVNSESATSTPVDLLPLNSIAPDVGDASPCPVQNDLLPGIDEADKDFVQNIFTLMGKEETFSGQVKLMEWILRIENSSVLSWFMTKGGVMILATWLSQASAEEQTSVLSIILEVLSHLPLHKALPSQLSAVLQTVNRLRFYRTSDVSNRAKALLSKWSKMFARAQVNKKPNGVRSRNAMQKEMMVKQSFGEIMGDEAWHSDNSLSEEILASCENLEVTRRLESSQALKLLPASADDSSRKHALGVTSAQNRERRKVQMVEQPGQKMAGRSPQASRVASASRSRPMSVDDIQKAKMRQLHMQNKYGKSGSSCNESNEIKTESSIKTSMTKTVNLPPAATVHVQSEGELQKNVMPSEAPQKLDMSFAKTKLDSRETVLEGCKRVRIPWKRPAEVKLDDQWRVGGGEDSKEVEFQKNRNRREKETIYRTVQEIPPNPKEPWDREMDYDDSLTPVISLEQLPDADVVPEAQVPSNENARAGLSSMSQNSNPAPAEPDLELLAVLLKNPEIVFALTSGGAGSLSSADTVRLLDMIKAGGGAAGNLNGLGVGAGIGVGGRTGERVEVSLPSPTPSSNPPVTGVWSADAVRNPFSRHNASASAASTSGSFQGHASTTVAPPLQASNFPATVRQEARNVQNSLSQSSQVHTHSMMAPSLQHRIPIESAAVQSQAQEAFAPMNGVQNPTSTGKRPMHSLPYSAVTSPQLQPMQRAHPSLYSGGPGPSMDMNSSWGGGREINHQYSHPHSYSQTNQSTFSASSRAPYERNNYAREDFESWSQENSPTRYPPGRNIPEARAVPDRFSGPESSRHGSSSGFWDHNRDHNRHGGRWQRDWRR